MSYRKIIIFILMITCFLASEEYYKNSKEKSDNNKVIPQTSNTFPFQGYFTDYLGRPYFGTVQMGFAFYNSEENGTEIYPDGDGLIRQVKVYNGLYATKISLPKDAFATLASYDNIWVEVYVIKGIENMSWDGRKDSYNTGTKKLKEKEYMLSPRVQLTAAPYALGVRGLSYYESDNGTNKVLKVGSYQTITNNFTNQSNSLIIPGNVRIATLNVGTNYSENEFDKNGTKVTLNAVNAKLFIPGILQVNNNAKVQINGSIAPTGGVHGAVWN